MEEYRRRFDKGSRRQAGKDYGRAQRIHQYRKEKYDRLWSTLTDEEKKAAQREIKTLRKRMLECPANNPLDDNYRRIQYQRYADDCAPRRRVHATGTVA